MNTNLQQLQPSATLALTAQAQELRAQGSDVVSLTAGEPDCVTPAHICAAATEALAAGHTHYTPVAGLPELRAALVEKFHRENNLRYTPEEVMVSAGGKQAIYNALLALCNPGDEILLPAPYWLSYPAQIRLCSATPVVIPTDGSVRADTLKTYITTKTRVLILNSPNNPTGAIIPKDELARIAALAQEHNLHILSDEVYEHFVYTGTHASIATYCKDRTLTLGSCSKTYAMTGWRLGFCAGPKELIATMTKIQSHTTSGPNSIAQYAALAALTGDQQCVRDMCDVFAKRRTLLMNGIQKLGLPYIQPDGAFYLFVDISSTGLSSTDFATQLLAQHHVAVVPGAPFGLDTHVRLSYACSDAQLTKGIKRIGELLKK